MPDAALTRRRSLEAAAAAGLLAAAAPASAETPPISPAPTASAPTVTATGVVFESRDGSFVRRPDDPGVPGVMVSNGEEVVLTDAHGRWSLPLAEGEAVFVVKPSGWRVPLDPVSGVPRDFYLYEPAGSPAQHFPGVAPTGPLPAAIAFGLQRRPEPSRFEALLVTDPQPHSDQEVSFVREALARRIAGHELAFAIDHGDTVYDDLSLYPRSVAIWGAGGLPWYHCRGNHDTNYDAADNRFAAETFKRHFGRRWGAFQYGGATFLQLDNVEYLGNDPARPKGVRGYRGAFGARQLAFVRNVLAHVPRESLVVAGFHIPLVTAQGKGPSARATDGLALLAALADHPHAVTFAGHTHTHEHWYLGAAEGFPGPGEHHHVVLAAGSGSWWSGPADESGIPLALETDGSPNGVHILSVDGTRWSTRLLPARGGPALRVVLESPAADAPPGGLIALPTPRAALEGARVVVNLFEGGPRSTVAFSLAGGPWQPMARAVRHDPFVEDVYARFAAVKKSWVKPGPSTHLFQAELAPAGLAALKPGTWPLRVRARDDQGRPSEALLMLEFTA